MINEENEGEHRGLFVNQEVKRLSKVGEGNYEVGKECKGSASR